MSKFKQCILLCTTIHPPHPVLCIARLSTKAVVTDAAAVGVTEGRLATPNWF